MKKWKIRQRKTAYGIRWDVATVFSWMPRVYLVSGLCGDDGHKTRAAAVKHALAKYGKQTL